MYLCKLQLWMFQLDWWRTSDWETNTPPTVWVILPGWWMVPTRPPSNPTLYLMHRPLQTLPLGGDTSRYTVPCKRPTKHHVTKGTLYHGVKQGSSVVTCSYARYTQRWIVCNGYTALVMVVVPGCLANSLPIHWQFIANFFVRLSTFWKEFSHIIYLIAQDWVAFSRLWIESVYQTALHHIIDIIDIASSLQDGDQRWCYCVPFVNWE